VASPHGAASAKGDEDCLYLNVWRPRNITSGSGLAIMVWIHGGSFEVGSGAQRALPFSDMYNGCFLAASQQVIVASMNYRLGPLGFAAFAMPDGSAASNFGMQDQREAMRWIRAEAAAFGGDPNKVTIFGESAGAISVMYHLASPASSGIFRAAISESGFPDATCLSRGLGSTATLAARLSCNGSTSVLNCLRTKSAAEVVVAAAEVPREPFSSASPTWQPVVDGVDMPEYPVKRFSEGQTHPVPFLAGSNTNEAALFIWPRFRPGMNDSRYRDYFAAVNAHLEPRQHLSDVETEQVFSFYPPSPTKDNRWTMIDLVTDATFLCNTRLAAASHSRHSDAYVYRFNHRSRCINFVNRSVPGVFHGCEVPYVFNNPSAEACRFDREEEALSRRMQEMWANMAKHLTPIADGTPPESQRFPRYDADSQRSLVLETLGDTVDERYRDRFCKLWYNVSWSKLAAPSTDAVFDLVV